MSARPILFSGPMVRALLAGTKTQTRRAVKWPEWVKDHDDAVRGLNVGLRVGLFRDGLPTKVFGCPYGQPGDELWVRETFVYRHKYDRYYYRADHPTFDPYAHNGWKPSIHMPRRASRFTLRVTSVRVERLQEISEADAMAEGARHWPEIPDPHPYYQGARWSFGEPESTDDCLGTARLAFANLWESLNGAESWAANPFCWVVGFEVCR